MSYEEAERISREFNHLFAATRAALRELEADRCAVNDHICMALNDQFCLLRDALAAIIR